MNFNIPVGHSRKPSSSIHEAGCFLFHSSFPSAQKSVSPSAVFTSTYNLLFLLSFHKQITQKNLHSQPLHALGQRWPHQFLAVQLGASHLTSPWLGFLLCKTELLIVPTTRLLQCLNEITETKHISIHSTNSYPLPVPGGIPGRGARALTQNK